MPELKTITDPDLPEPKGISVASDGQVMLADGAGSGAWQSVVIGGWENYNHGGGSQALTSAARTKVLNDGAGAITSTTYGLPGSTNVWDAANNQFDWAAGGLLVGDAVIIRFDITYTVNTANDSFDLEMDFAVGGTSPFTLDVDHLNLDASGTITHNRYLNFFIGSDDVLNNPAELYITANSASDSILVNGFFIEAKPRTLRMA